jgi:hypothetical protein
MASLRCARSRRYRPEGHRASKVSGRPNFPLIGSTRLRVGIVKRAPRQGAAFPGVRPRGQNRLAVASLTSVRFGVQPSGEQDRLAVFEGHGPPAFRALGLVHSFRHRSLHTGLSQPTQRCPIAAGSMLCDDSGGGLLPPKVYSWPAQVVLNQSVSFRPDEFSTDVAAQVMSSGISKTMIRARGFSS